MMRRILLTHTGPVVGRTGATLEIVKLPTQSYGGRLEGELIVERTFPPGGGRSLAHRHMDFDETYEVLEGIADAQIDGLDLRLRAKQTLRIPSGASHVNPHSRDNTGLKLRQTIANPTDAALAYVNTLIQVMKQRRDDDGELPPLATLAVFEGMQGRTYLSQLPVWSQQKLLMPIGARIARQRGYKVWPARLP